MEWRTDKNCKSILGATVLFCILFKFIGAGDAAYPFMASIAYPALFIALGLCRRIPKSIQTYGKRLLRIIICILIPAFVGTLIFAFIEINVDTADTYATLAGKAIQSLYTCVDVSVDSDVYGAQIFGILISMGIVLAVYDLLEYILNNRKHNLVCSIIEFIIFSISFVFGLYLLAHHILGMFDPALILMGLGFMYFGKLFYKMLQVLNEKSLMILSIVFIPLFGYEWFQIISIGKTMNLSTILLQSTIGGTLSTVLGSIMLLLAASLLVRIKPIKNIFNYFGDHLVIFFISSLMNFVLFHKYFPDWPRIVLVISSIYTIVTVELINKIFSRFINYSKTISVYLKESYIKYINIIQYSLFGILIATLFIGWTHMYSIIPGFFYCHGVIESFCCGLSLLIFVFDPRMKEQTTARLLWYFIIYGSALLYMSIAGYIIMEWYVFGVFSMMISLSNLSFYKIVKCSFIILIIGIAITMTLSIVGIIPNELEFNVKHTFGFLTANVFALYVYMVMLEYFYLRAYGSHKHTILLALIDCMFFGFGLIIIWQHAKGRTSEVSSLILAASVIVWEIYQIFFESRTKKMNSTFHKFMKISLVTFIAVLIFSYIRALYFNPANPGYTVDLIGELTDPATYVSRLDLSQITINKYMPHLFGHYLQESSGDNYYIIDNVFVRLIYRYGLALTIIYISSMTYNIYRLWRKYLYAGILILICVASVGYMESGICNLSVSIFSLIAYTDLTSKTSINENSEHQNV